AGVPARAARLSSQPEAEPPTKPKAPRRSKSRRVRGGRFEGARLRNDKAMAALPAIVTSLPYAQTDASPRAAACDRSLMTSLTPCRGLRVTAGQSLTDSADPGEN